MEVFLGIPAADGIGIGTAFVIPDPVKRAITQHHIKIDQVVIGNPVLLGDTVLIPVSGKKLIQVELLFVRIPVGTEIVAVVECHGASLPLSFLLSFGITLSLS